MRLLKIIIATMPLFLAGRVSAQELSHVERRAMSRAVIDRVYDLELYSAVNSKNDRYNLVRLFENGTASVFCDLATDYDSYLRDIPVTDYADFLLDKCKDVEVSFSDLRKGQIRRAGNGVWLYDVAVSKKIEYTDYAGGDGENAVLVPFGVDSTLFVLQVTYVFKNSFDNCSIRRIQCVNKDDFAAAKDSYIVQRHPKGTKDAGYDDQLEIDGSPLRYNSFRQACAPSGEVSLWDDDIRISKEVLAESPSYQLVQFRYSPKHFRLRLRNEIALGGAYSIAGAEGFSKKETKGYDAGLDFGYAFPLSSKVKMSVFAGLGVSFTSLDFGTEGSYSYPLTDRSGNLYQRQYNLTSVTQGITCKDLLVPVYLSLDFKISKTVSLFVDAGVKTYYNTNAEVDPFHVTGSIAGVYPNGMVTNDGDGFGGMDESYNEFVSAVAFKRESIDVSAFGNIGVDINVYKGLLFVEVKAGYESGLTQSYKSDNNVFLDADAGMLPLVYSDALSKDIVVRPLADCVSFKRQAIWGNLGLMLKF